ncbi:RNA polymerase sigma factor [Micromonospora zhanjiangensis]|uniref:RNA polymerase sigma factor n=1 Tax=Micromonospora zhanjiangensis TaxID=1522057 RepID=A0ABV8KRW0_9ACTN
MIASPHQTRQDDVVLLRQSRTEPEHFARLFDRYHREIHRLVANRLGPDLADDLAAETFLVAFDKRARFDPDPETGGGHVRAWLYGIATNLIRRHHRTEERRYRALARAPKEPFTADHDDLVAARVSAQHTQRALAAALASLSAKDRDVILLVAFGDLDYGEVAAALGIPYGTVCSRLNRARRKIRQAMGGVDPTRDDLRPTRGGQRPARGDETPEGQSYDEQSCED